MEKLIEHIEFSGDRNIKVPVYIQVADYLSAGIRERGFTAAMEFPDERSLSVKLGVNRRTLRKALDILVNAGLIYKIHGKGIFIRDLRPKEELSLLTLSHLRTVMLTVPESIEHHRESLVRQGAVEYFHEHDLEVIVASCNGRNDEYERIYRRREILQGVLLHRWSGHIWPETLDWLNSYGLPTVVCGVDGDKFNVDFVGMKVSRGIGKIAEYFLRRGHRKIIFIAQNVPLCLNSEQGYIQAMDAAGLEAVVLGRYANPPVLLSARTDLNVVLQGYHETLGYFRKRQRVDAIIAESSCCAVGILSALKELGIAVPNDVELIAFGDDPVAERHYTPAESPISTVSIPYHEIGRKAAAMLLRRIDSPDVPVEKTEFEPQLVLRHTTNKQFLEKAK